MTLENVEKEVFLSRGLSSRPLEECSHQDRLSALVLVANRFPKLGSFVQGLSLGLREGLFQSLKAKCRGKAFFFFLYIYGFKTSGHKQFVVFVD